MKPIQVKSRQGNYEVVVQRGAFGGLGERLRKLGLSGRVALITDANVERHWGAWVRKQLKTAFGAVPTQVLKPGEATKSLASAEALYAWLAEQRLTRADAVLALGGGVVGDLAGFVAATYHRGLPLVQLPTSLLAMADSSIGGKVGVDLPQGKNLVGAFYAPRAVIAETETLFTLPVRERWNGLAEVAKAALIGNLSLLKLLEEQLEALGEGRADPTGAVVRAAQLKADIVSGDELESGRRMLLNFGHTLGHALEAATGYGPLLHGEAVVVGMRAAVELSLGHGLSQAARQRAVLLLKRFPSPGELPRPKPRAVLDALGRDKKGRRFILLRKLGQAEVSEAVTEADLKWAVTFGIRALEDWR